MNQFLCVTMAEAADSNASDQFIGRDVERFPGGDYNKFLTSCKSCHSVMDAMRPAFGKMDYTNFTNGAATGIYSQMNGQFFKNHNLSDNYSKYFTDTFKAAIDAIIPDLEKNQENSEYYKVRYAFEYTRGMMAANADPAKVSASVKASIMATLNTIRDPQVALDIAANYRTKNAAIPVSYTHLTLPTKA